MCLFSDLYRNYLYNRVYIQVDLIVPLNKINAKGFYLLNNARY